MKRRHVWIGGLVLLCCVSASTRTDAFLGFGDIVFDPSVYAQAVEQVIRLERQYAQLVQSYQMMTNQYNQLVLSAKRVPVNMTARYRAVVTPWRNPGATNTYGTTSAWMAAITTGQGVATGYAQSTEPLQAYGAGLANVPADQLPHLKASYGTVELTDGAAQSAMETIGRLRANAPAVQNAILGLEDDSLSSTPEMNTEVAVLNKINAANLVAIRNSQDTNKLLVALAEAQVIQSTRNRDAEVRAINQHARFLAEGRRVLTAQAVGASDAMRAWRMP